MLLPNDCLNVAATYVYSQIHTQILPAVANKKIKKFFCTQEQRRTKKPNRKIGKTTTTTTIIITTIKK